MTSRTSADGVAALYPANAADPYELHQRAALQYARWSKAIRAGGHLGFPWLGVDQLVGRLLPSWFVLVGARAKGGKSTFLRECLRSWVWDFGKKVLYVGTEQEAGILRALLACIRLQLPVEAALDPTHPDHERVVEDVMRGQTERDMHERAIIVAEADLTLEVFLQWARYAYREHCDVLMLDHFHRMGTVGARPWDEQNEAARQLKNIGVKGNMLVVAAAQLKNGDGGPLGEFEVPGSQSWAGTAGLRRECDLAIQLWRPFRTGVTREQKAAARDDAALLADLVQPGVMAVRADAHRYRDVPSGKAARLFVHDGQISSWTQRTA